MKAFTLSTSALRRIAASSANSTINFPPSCSAASFECKSGTSSQNHSGRIAPVLPLVDGATRVTGSVVDRARFASSRLAWLLTRRYGFGTARPSRSLVSFVERMNSRTPTDTVARYLRTLYTHARYPALDALRTIPVLVICGTHDQITPMALSEEICRRLPDAELVPVPGSGHVVLLEHSEVVNEALDRFLEKVQP